MLQAEGENSAGIPLWQAIGDSSRLPATGEANPRSGGSRQRAGITGGAADMPQGCSRGGGLLSPVRQSLGKLVGGLRGGGAEGSSTAGGFEVPEHWKAWTKDGQVLAQEKIER